ncbi:flippase [Candidatus Gracilibacteria bacterium]|nr:flippase [Candidatus Gracilibacteria bacterium]
MSTALKILSNTVAQIIGKFAVAILGLVSVKIATSYLSVGGYGEYTAIYSFLAFFGIAADLGLFTIAVREMSENEDEVPKIIGNILSIRTILVVLIMGVAIVSAFLIPAYEDTRISLGVAVASITVILTIMNGTTTSVLQAKLKMHQASIATVVGKIVTVGFMLYVVFWGFPEDNEMGFYMLLVAGNVGALIMELTTRYYVKKFTSLKYRFDFGFWKQILSRSIPYGLALILNTVYLNIGPIMLSIMGTKEQVGIYGVATKMLEQFSILPLYFMNSVLPVLTKSIKENSEKYKDIIKYAFDFLCAMSIPLVVGGVILAYPIVFAVSTPDFLSRLSEGYFGSDFAFQILIFALLFQFINVLFAFIMIAVNKQYRLLYINASCVLLNIVGNIALIPHLGFRSCAIMSVVSEFFILILNYTYAKKSLPFSLNFTNLFKIIFSALIMGVVIYFGQIFSYSFLQNWNLIVLVPFGGAIYVAMLFATKVIDKNMLNLLRGKPRAEEIQEPGQIS